LHEDLNLIQHTPKYEAIQDLPHDSLAVRSNRWWKNYTDRNDSFIVDLFAGQLQSTLTCLECDHKSIVYDPFWDLSLPLSSSGKSSMSYSAGVKLDDCFRFFTTPETLQGDDMPYCSKCKTHRASTKKMVFYNVFSFFTQKAALFLIIGMEIQELYRFPDVLVVHLKRFAVGRYGGRGDKLTTNVDFPLENLDLSEFAAPGALASAGSSAAVYDLFAISNHMGSLGGGHYTAHAKTGADSVRLIQFLFVLFSFSLCSGVLFLQWSTFNDSRVSPVSTSSLGGSSAYVLFFHRKK
jgi:ubiquitin C-terminal hydrolase